MSISTTSILQPADEKAVARLNNRPGRSPVSISTSVAVSLASESNRTCACGARFLSARGGSRNSRLASVLPRATRRIISWSRSASCGLLSRARFVSANTNVSSTTPLALEKASAFKMSRPKLEMAPANDANSGRNRKPNRL